MTERAWPREEMEPEEAEREYPELWARLSERFEGWSAAAIAAVASFVVDTCPSCHAENRTCQCWNDD